MGYSKFRSIIRTSLPAEEARRLTPEQIDKLKTAGSFTLAILGAVGVITLSAVAPNMFYALDKIFGKKSNRKYSRKQTEEKIMGAFYYLKRHNYIIIKPAARDFKIFLTKLGRKKLNELSFQTVTVPKPKKWDKRWWQIAADIPTKKYKWAADALRKKLKDMKFFPLQRTLWFYPYDPRQEVEFIINRFSIGQFVTTMEVSRLDFDDEQKMRDFFEREKIL